jgi:hypothetical protein
VDADLEEHEDASRDPVARLGLDIVREVKEEEELLSGLEDGDNAIGNPAIVQQEMIHVGPRQS